MRRLIRALPALAALGAMLALGATATLAGGYAEATIVGDDAPPVAGEERELRVLLLQHGIAPVERGEVHVSAWLPATGERMTVAATSVGAGEWTATVTFPSDGDWQLQVTHSDLVTPPPMSVAVAPPPGPMWLPATAAIGASLLAAATLIGATLFLASGRAGPKAAAPAREAARIG